jgi:hypothetical protein
VSKINLQNTTKTRRYLECFEASPGNKVVAMDFASLEPKVLAYFSRDKNLMSLYGPNAKKNDIYLFNGAQLKGLGEPILATGYDPYNPTPETIKAAKKACKTERQIAKKFTLSANYGAGARKIHSELLLDGVDVTLEQCYQFHKEFWNLYPGIKLFSPSTPKGRLTPFSIQPSFSVCCRSNFCSNNLIPGYKFQNSL